MIEKTHSVDSAIDTLRPMICDQFENTQKSKKEIAEEFGLRISQVRDITRGVAKEYKLCHICGEDDKFNFYEQRRNKCISCMLEELRIKTIEKPIIITPEQQAHIKATKLLWVQRNIIKVRARSAYHRALRSGIQFEIDEDFIYEQLMNQDYRCYWSGVPLDFLSQEPRGDVDTRLNPNSISIDKINPKLGYTRENTCLVTSAVNQIKNDFPTSELDLWISRIYHYRGLQNLDQKNSQKNFWD